MAGYPSDCGHRDYLVSRTDRALASNPMLSPAAKARILGKAPIFLPSKSHRITVDIKSGARTVDSTDITLTAPATSPIVRRSRSRVMTPRLRIFDAVIKAWKIGPEELMSRSRQRRIAYPRFACFQFLASLGWSTPQIGKVFGRDHTTVMHGLKRAEWLQRRDPDWRARYAAALAELKGSPA